MWWAAGSPNAVEPLAEIMKLPNNLTIDALTYMVDLHCTHPSIGSAPLLVRFPYVWILALIVIAEKGKQKFVEKRLLLFLRLTVGYPSHVCARTIANGAVCFCHF